MNEMAKGLRAKMRAKAQAMSSQKDSKTDSSDWSPAEPINAEVKTGMRPVSRRAYKTGGKVEGETCAPRADRKPRKKGGEVESEKAEAKEYANAKVNRDVKAANEEREGIKHVGGMKKGGRAEKNQGGFSTQKDASEEMSEQDQARAAAAAKAARDRAQQEGAHGRKDGGRTKKMSGGLLAGLAGGVGPAAAAGAFDGKDEKKSGGRAKRKDGGKVNYGPMETPDSPKGPTEKQQRATEDHQRDSSKAKRAKAQQYADGGYLKFKGEPVIPGMKAGGRMARKDGGRTKKTGTNVNIVIQTKPSAPSMPGAPGMGDMPMPKPPGGLPVPMPPSGAPPMPMGGIPMPPPAPPLGGGLPGGMPPMARKAGGRITKVAKSYKDMEAGSGGAEGRLQKTDIAKTGKGAPTYKKGGKVYASFKDMDAGAGSGEGRLEKTEIQKRAH